MPHILLPCPPLNPTTTFLLFALDMEAPSSKMTAWFHLHISLSERERSWERIKKTHMLLLRPLGQPWAYNKHLNVTPLKLTSAMIRKEGKRRCYKVKNYTNINPGDCLNFTLRPAVTSRIISETWLLEENPDISGTHTGLLVCTFLFILSSYVCWCRTFPQILVIKVYSFFALSKKIDGSQGQEWYQFLASSLTLSSVIGPGLDGGGVGVETNTTAAMQISQELSLRWS